MDFTKLQVLVGPRHRQARMDRDDRERLGEAHLRRAKGKKNHSTNKERSHLERTKSGRARKEAERQRESVMDHKRAVAEYWSGNRGEHP